jgi:uncharacterized protein
MKPLAKKFSFLVVLSVLFILSAAVKVPAVEGPPADYIEDRAGIIDASTKAGLSSRLKALDQKTGIQMVVLTVPSTEGIPIEEYSIERAQKWGIGQKGKDNGILFVVAVNDRKYRIEVGYGLESVMPDSLAGTIGRQYMVPKFRQGDFSGGINDAANAVIGTVAKAYGTEVEGTAPAEPVRQSKGKVKSIPSAFLLIFVAFIVLSRIFSPFGRRSFGRRHGGIWIGGGGFGGGGSFGGGGFSGGGGGFGGGGSSGGW